MELDHKNIDKTAEAVNEVLLALSAVNPDFDYSNTHKSIERFFEDVHALRRENCIQKRLLDSYNTQYNEPITFQMMKAMIGKPVYDAAIKSWMIIEEYAEGELRFHDGTTAVDDPSLSSSRFFMRWQPVNDDLYQKMMTSEFIDQLCDHCFHLLDDTARTPQEKLSIYTDLKECLKAFYDGSRIDIKMLDSMTECIDMLIDVIRVEQQK